MLGRPITSGSRQAPDPFDQFLESRSMYRKHTARDASCLFRVIAEQMYDTQMLHYEVRLECVRFMTRKRRIFEQHVRGDFDSYMMDMAKPKTYGTMLELRALCCMYRRNVILFEPYNLGTTVTYNEQYQDIFRVFYTNEYHFDSVYTLEYIELAAICQSISFKLLYKMLFKIPDVDFAVETMLHRETFDWCNYSFEYDSGYMVRIVCSDGRSFELDLPENTKCVLENYKLCSFHKNAATPKTRQQHQQNRNTLSATDNGTSSSSTSGSSIKQELPNDSVMANRSTDMRPPMYPHLISCVRQLLNDGITPFPYKVAKSLDPYMYRNIEFDSWSDMRKEAKRYNVYANDYNFKVGAKCRVELQTENDRQLYTCHIQKIGADKSFCVVFVEHFGKEYLVPYEALHPMPPEEFTPWDVPVRYQRQMQRVQLAKLSVHKPKMQKWKKAKVFDVGKYFEARKCELVQYLQLDACAYAYPQVPTMHNELQVDPHPQQHTQHQHQQQQLQLQPQGDLHEDHQLQQRGDQRLPSRGKHVQPALPTATAVGGTAAGSGPQLVTAAAPPAAQYVNYMPLPGRPGLGQVVPPPWPGAPMPMPEEFQAGVFPGPPLPGNGCMLMHFGGYVPQPPAPPAAHSHPHPTGQPFATPPFLFAPQLPMARSAVMLPTPPPPPQAAGRSNSQTGTGTTTYCSDDQSEVRRSLQSNGEDLPEDLGTLRYFYNIGVDTHMRQFNHFNTDQQHHQQQQQQQQQHQQQQHQQQQQQQQQQQHKQNNEETVSSEVPTVTSTSASAESAAAAGSTKTPPRGRSKRDAAFNKGRYKRPEQLHDLNLDSQQQQQQALYAMQMLTPSPTPSPNTNSNQFNFYPTAQPPPPPAAAAAQQPMPPIRPQIYFAPKGAQNPYAWGMGPPPPPQVVPPVVGIPPYEVINMDTPGANGAVQQTLPQPTSTRH